MKDTDRCWPCVHVAPGAEYCELKVWGFPAIGHLCRQYEYEPGADGDDNEKTPQGSGA